MDDNMAAFEIIPRRFSQLATTGPAPSWFTGNDREGGMDNDPRSQYSLELAHEVEHALTPQSQDHYELGSLDGHGPNEVDVG
eukprot:5137661-Karenia_brevis.AAC.1